MSRIAVSKRFPNSSALWGTALVYKLSRTLRLFDMELLENHKSRTFGILVKYGRTMANGSRGARSFNLGVMRRDHRQASVAARPH